MGYTQLFQIGRSIVISDDVIAANIGAATTGSVTYVKLKACRLIENIYPTSSIRFKVLYTTGGGHALFKVLRNDTQVIIPEQNVTATGTFIQDVSFIDLTLNDEFEVYGAGLPGNTMTIDEFRLCGFESPFNNSVV